MKKFSQLNEACVTADVNPGNGLAITGVTNHYTPIENILMNVKNLFAAHLGVVAAIAEDGVSIKLNSSKFINKDEVNKVLYEYGLYRNLTLAGYIMSQGLNILKIVPIGQYCVVYFSPSDISYAMPGLDGCEPENAKTACKCTEMLNDTIVDEIEMLRINEDSGDDDEEIEDSNHKKVVEIIDMKDKVKAAKKLEDVVAKAMELPRDYYFAGVKDKEGNESIALRWKYTKRRPKGMSAEITVSLINIFGTGKDGVWVGYFDKDSMVTLPEEVTDLINNILKDILGAEKTDDEAVWSISKDNKKKDKDDKDKDKDKDKDEDKKDKDEDKKDDSTDKKDDDDEDTEDDSSREEADDLL